MLAQSVPLALCLLRSFGFVSISSHLCFVPNWFTFSFDCDLFFLGQGPRPDRAGPGPSPAQASASANRGLNRIVNERMPIFSGTSGENPFRTSGSEFFTPFALGPGLGRPGPGRLTVWGFAKRSCSGLGFQVKLNPFRNNSCLPTVVN